MIQVYRKFEGGKMELLEQSDEISIYKKNNKIVYLEFLRVFASILVITIHVSATRITKTEGLNWHIINFFDGLARFAVPIFFMITGVLFLDLKKEISIKKIYIKNIKKLVVIFIFWSTLYAIVGGIESDSSIKQIIKNIIVGHYHLWFIYALIGIYMMVPLLRKIVEDKKTSEYFLILWFLVGIVIYTIGRFPQFKSAYSIFQSKFHIYMVLGYSGYVILGYYIHNYKFTTKMRKIIYCLGIFGTVVTIVGNALLKNNQILFSYFSPNVVLMAMAFFMLIKYNKKLVENEKINTIILKISNLTLGIYLVHVLILEHLKYFGINVLTLSPIIMIPLMIIIIFVISGLITFVLKKLKLNYLV